MILYDVFTHTNLYFSIFLYITACNARASKPGIHCIAYNSTTSSLFVSLSESVSGQSLCTKVLHNKDSS